MGCYPQLLLFVCCRESGSSNSDHARVQSSEFWNLAVWRVGWYRKVGVVEREFKNISEVEFGVVAQTCTGIGSGVFAL